MSVTWETGIDAMMSSGKRLEGAMLLGAGLVLAACGDFTGRDAGTPVPTGLTNASGPGTGDGSGTGDGVVDVDEGEDVADDDGAKLDVQGMGEGPMETGEDGCEALVDEADVVARPQDIIIVVDNSSSMEEEAGFVQTQLNSFSIQIDAANVDSHIVLISAGLSADAGVCLEPPLGSGGCPGDESQPPEYVHLDIEVESNNALEKIITHYPDYSEYLRPTAVTHVVVVTDDDSDMSAADFMAEMAGLSRHLAEFTFHGIIKPEDQFRACLNGTACCEFSSGARGTVYQTLIDSTGGVEGNLCEQLFQPVFQAVAQQVLGGATLPCSYEIPPPPRGETFDQDEVNVEFDDGEGGLLEIGRVDEAAMCDAVGDGWYYDNPDDPGMIVVCPQTCTKIQGFETASIAISFGCATIPAG